MSRHLARETAFKMLFQMDVGNNDFAMAEHTLAESKLKGGYKAFALELVQGVHENQFELNEYLKKFTRGWELERLAAVDRNLIKMAMFEMKQGKTPANIVMNEAVELAKEFGSNESPSFINAVLDKFHKKVMMENDAEYQVDESLKEQYLTDMAAAKKRAELSLKDELIDEDFAAPKQENKAEKIKENFAEENKMIKKQGFRKIKKADISERDVIKADDLLADKKRIYGENAFLTKKDIREALDAGAVLPEEILEEYFKTEKPIRDKKY